ncbi:PaaI family thioesterase [Novosphingobium sp.]|uniref:PaaI family thioesterase n=1 Tax=Novosphingobium sp. TaxID=1874826 RepID=UPI0026259E3F|nr:PaaI family thioesterase [Novosphingobium sp.]
MSLIAEIASPDMTGLEQLQALLAQGKQPGIGGTLRFSAIAFDHGLAVFEGEPGEHAHNPIGTVHGGYIATLLDSACGCAVHSRLAPGQTYTTLELKVAYHKAVTAKTGTVRAEGRVVSIGRRAAFAEARLTDMAGVLLASATSSLLIMSV